MSHKQIGLFTAAAFLLVALGSALGAGIYATFFDKKYVYLSQPAEPSVSFSRFTPSPAAPQGSQALPDFVSAAQLARPAVVYIKSHFSGRGRQGGNFFGNPFGDFFNDKELETPPGLASGSGVLISADGYIATNNHVIQDADRIEVLLLDNRSFEAQLLGVDPSTDLALLKIEGEGLPFLSFGDSDALQVGQWVLAIGNPMDLTSTVTAGIVSAKGRNINLLNNDSRYAIESFIQTDAAVNKGNSGGALVDTEGRLMGINTAIASRTGYYAGYSFAVPASIARRVMEDLLSYGKVRRGYLGVSIQPVDADLARSKSLSVFKGAFVSGINPRLGASVAGIREGDIIVSVNGTEVNSSSELQEQVNRYRPGDQLELRVIRGKENKTFRVPLMELPEEESELSAAEEERSLLEYEDHLFRMPTREELEDLGVAGGVIVEKPGARFLQNGVNQGFLITEINRKPIRSLGELEKALDGSEGYLALRGLYGRGENASYSFEW